MNKLSISQINEVLSRSVESIEIKIELSELQRISEDISNQTLFEYIPIKIVACFESFFRELYKEIIDNQKYRKNLNNITKLKNTNIDFEVLSAFHENDVSIGEYFAYLFPCSKFEDINNTMSSLLEINFAEEIKKGLGNDILKSINQIFKLRHMLCHEMPQSLDINKESIIKYLKDSCDFIDYSEMIFNKILYPKELNTTYEMKMDVAEKFNAIEKELDDLVQRIRNLDIPDYFMMSKELDYIADWKKYREERAKQESKMCEGGTIYGIVYAHSLINTTIAFIKELKTNYRKFLLK